MGGAEKLAKRKAEGVLNARERIDYLVDADSFIESGRFARSHRPEVKHKTPADGKIAGFARIEGRGIALVSNDFTVLGASSSVINMKKIKHVKQAAANVKPAEIEVTVLNGTSVPGLAATFGDKVEGKGFSLGAVNTEPEIDRVIAILPAIVEKLRTLTRATGGPHADAYVVPLSTDALR